MKRDWIEKAQDWFALGLNHLLFIASAITVLDLFQADNNMLLLWIGTFVIPVAYYLIIKKPQKILPPPFFIAILAALSMIEKIMDKNDWSIFYFVIALIYITGYFLYYYLTQYQQFLVLNKASASNIPEQDMLKNGLKQTSVFAVGGFIVLFMSANFDWFSKIADQIWNWILGILRMIFSGIHTEPPVEEVEKVEEIQQNLSGVGDAVEEVFFPELLQGIAQTAATLVVFVAFVGGCIVFMLVLVELFKRYFIPHNRKKDINALENSSDVREYCGVEKRAHQAKTRFSFFDNRKKIRKLYHKKMLQHKSEIIGGREDKQLKYFTAKECCDRISVEGLKNIYEKARYSNEEISSEDVRVAKYE